jgi:hypothetical protein
LPFHSGPTIPTKSVISTNVFNFENVDIHHTGRQENTLLVFQKKMKLALLASYNAKTKIQ